MKKPVNISISTDKLIPHKDKIKMIHNFTPRNEDTSESTITIKNSMFLNMDNTLGRVVIPELFSQVYAAQLEYFDKLNRGPDNLGFLVSIKDLIFYDDINKKDTIKISVTTLNEIQSFHIVSGIVFRNDRVIAKGNMKFWIPEKDADVIKESISMKRPQKLFNPPEYFKLDNNPLKKEILKSIYKITKNNELLQTHLYLDKDFTGFSGHFPEFPVLPGAVILEIGKFLIEIYIKKEIRVIRIDNVKFSNIIMPEQEIIFKMKNISENLNNPDKLVFKVFSNNILYSSFIMDVI